MRIGGNTVLIGGGIIVILVGVVIYLVIVERKKDRFEGSAPWANPKGYISQQGAPSQPNLANLVLFHMTGCGHCRDMMGEWQNTTQQLNGKMKTTSLEASNPEVRRHNVNGFPTIRFFPEGLEDASNYAEYKGPRTTNEIVRFAMTQAERSRGQ